VFTKGGGLWLEQIADSGADAIGLDWTVNLGDARRRAGDKVALQGNIDPAVLFAEPAQIREQVIATLDAYGTPSAGHGHVFNLGHGISQHTPPEAVSVLVETVRIQPSSASDSCLIPCAAWCNCTRIQHLQPVVPSGQRAVFCKSGMTAH
jgi:uroporphyrinogen-III decarboxylase